MARSHMRKWAILVAVVVPLTCAVGLLYIVQRRYYTRLT